MAMGANNLALVSAINLASGSTIAFGSSSSIYTANGTQNNGNSGVNFDLGTGSVTFRISSLTSTAKTNNLGSLSGGANTILEGSAVGSLASFVTDTAKIGGLNTSTTFSGTIRNGQGAGTNHIVALEKVGSGTLTLSGNNSYSSTTTVTGGTLKLDAASGSAAGGTTNVVVGVGATLLISKSDQVNSTAAVTLSGGTIAKGSGVINETFGALTLSSTSFLDFGTGTGNFTFSTFNPASVKLTLQNFYLGNSLTVNTGTFAAGDFNFGSFGYSLSGVPSGGFTITAVPEPSTVLAALGLAGLLLWPSRRHLLGAAKRMATRS
jgi:autotransporter-associated beta strand protein